MKKHYSMAMVIAAASLLAAACQTATTGADSKEEALYTVRDYVGDGVFTQGIEGPAVGPDGNLYLVNFAQEGTIGRVTTKEDGTGNAELFVKLPEGSVGNGIRFDRAGEMYIADYVGHNILRVNPASRQVDVFAHNPAMNQPNDIAISATGILYASDPKWADNSGQLWRIDRDGTTTLLEAGMGTTNGVEVSTDEKHLYVSESVQRRIWSYDILESGALANKRLLIEFADHGLDGMRCDSQGNLYIARYGAGVVAVVSPAGQLLREIPLKGQKPTNLAFGGDDGRTLYVTLQERGAIEVLRVEHPGRAHQLRR